MIPRIMPLEIPMQWPGKSCGVRAPVFGEIPLSHDEVAFAMRSGLLDLMRILVDPAVIEGGVTSPAPAAAERRP